MASDNCDPVWRSVCDPRRPGIARHKDQKSFRAIAHTESQTPKEETDTNSIARDFAETKESFSDSIAIPDAEKQIKAQKSISYSNTERIALGNRDSVSESGGTNRSCSRKKGLAQRFTVAGPNCRLRQRSAKSSPNPGRRPRADKAKSGLHLWLCRSHKWRDGLLRFRLLHSSAKRFP